MKREQEKHWFFIQTEFKSVIEFCTFSESKMIGWRSISAQYPTREALIKGADIQPDPCVKCGRMWGALYLEECRKILLERKMCFNCSFWVDRLAKHIHPKSLHKSAIVDGVAYWLNPMASGPPQFRGHSGRKFITEFDDGVIVESNDVWCQGNVPSHFKDALPNNAKFIPQSTPKIIIT